ncbi:Copper resistance protein C precursor [Arthrobacter saudimassiliensis]|uniref:Copper resistance protein C n=1 Tax=Arthrobacter saudimassiliensis TaxID=1461584 RepID=A0A078MU77_9MICC|nr:Copper resistance protein C precursor [Arthrobacter saudimassiliensis]
MTHHSTASRGTPAATTTVLAAPLRPLSTPDAVLRLIGALMLALATVAAGLAATLATAPTALAHDQLISANPADGDVLAEPPAAVELVFSAELMDLGNEIRVEDAAGADVTGGELQLQRETLTQPLAALEDGTYEVTWRAVSSDGHPITGSFGFQVGSGGADNPAADAAPGQDQAGGGTGTASPDTAEASPNAEAGGASARGDGSGLPGWVPAAGLGGLAGIGIYAAAVWLRRRSRRGTD